MRWVGHAECVGEMRNAYTIRSESLKGRDHLEDLGVDWGIAYELSDY
jgi:hypothetical protein